MNLCRQCDRFQVVPTQNMEFFVLRTAGSPLPGHNLESQEVLHVQMVCTIAYVQMVCTINLFQMVCAIKSSWIVKKKQKLPPDTAKFK